MTKESKKKLRRWSFAIEVDGKGFHIPVVTFGSSARAESIAKHVAEDYKQIESLKDKPFKVAKIPHETISLATQQQLDGLEFELKIMSKVISLLRLEIDTDSSDGKMSDDEWNRFIGGYTVQAKKELIEQYYPEGAGKAINDSIEREEAALESDDYKMPLGKDAYDEVLNGNK